MNIYSEISNQIQSEYQENYHGLVRPGFLAYWELKQSGLEHTPKAIALKSLYERTKAQVEERRERSQEICHWLEVDAKVREKISDGWTYPDWVESGLKWSELPKAAIAPVAI